jgi:hypothetical protein
MSTKKSTGNDGEEQVVKLIPCPNCGKPLMRLPKDYPLYDLQCTGCLFRVQVKTNNSKPKKEVLGAGYNVLEKVLKVGIVMPPLILNFVWTEANVEKQKILFYPFIPKSHIKVRELKARPGYRMYNYINLDKLPYFVLYEK